MAEARDEQPSLPPRGKVQAVRKQWSVHEDGALAYRMQNQEIDSHYGLNRFNRRTVREDIPVAKIVQTEEELRQQEERMRELEALKAQAEEDEKVAKIMSEELKNEAVSHEMVRELDDEEIARQLQEKEKKKYEKHLEKKREKKLKQERQMLEAALARDTEEARLALNSDAGSDNVADSMESLNLQGVNVTRVTPAGRIEDDGDFSDFYNLPSEMDEFTRLEIQASQDEELARLLQEQEHKRTKAEVDQLKLRKIELQDEQLARVMQEQEKIRLKKAKEKHKQKKEAQRQKSAENMPLGASANTMHQIHQQAPPSPIAGSQAVPIQGGHTRYRRNSYTQAFDSPPSPPRSQPPPRRTAESTNQEQPRKPPGAQNTSSAVSISSQNKSRARQQMEPPLSSSYSHTKSAYIGPGGGMSTLESARRIAAGDHERIMAMQSSSQVHSPVTSHRGGSLQERGVTPRDASNTMDIIRAHSQHSKPSKSNFDSPHTPHTPQSDAVLYSAPYGHQMGAELRDSDATEVLKWLNTQDRGNHNNLPRHQQPGNAYDDGEDDPPHGSYPNGSSGFNIAAVIDPTYKRRHPGTTFNEETDLKSHIPFSRSLPQADGELEWDPGLRGSLRKTRPPIHGYQDSSASSPLSHPGGGGEGCDPVMSSWQPVQGQRRGEGKSRNKAKKQNSSGSDTKKDKGNCKQQ